MTNLTVTLKQLNQDLTKAERQTIDTEMKYYKIVVALKKLRQELGYTQNTLAKKSKVPRTTITKVESGSRNATLQTLMMLAQAMGKNLELHLT